MTINSPTRIWLVRHGQTDWNAQRRIQGHTPTELNAVGQSQANFLADWLVQTRHHHPFTAIYTSDLPRASQTAQIIGGRLNLPISSTSQLRERDLGTFEGKTWDEVRKTRVANGSPMTEYGDLADWTGVLGVESDEQLWQRVSTVLNTISQKHAGTDILAVTHGGLMKHVIWHILGLPAGVPRRFPLTNGLIAIIEPRTGGWFLTGLFDVGLLSGQQTEDTASTPSA